MERQQLVPHHNTHSPVGGSEAVEKRHNEGQILPRPIPALPPTHPCVLHAQSRSHGSLHPYFIRPSRLPQCFGWDLVDTRIVSMHIRYLV